MQKKIMFSVSLNPETWEQNTPAKPELQSYTDAANWKVLFQGRFFHHTCVFY